MITKKNWEVNRKQLKAYRLHGDKSDKAGKKVGEGETEQKGFYLNKFF